MFSHSSTDKINIFSLCCRKRSTRNVLPRPSGLQQTVSRSLFIFLLLFFSDVTKLLWSLQLRSKNKTLAVEFSEECPLIYRPSARLMLQISVSEVCHSLPTGPVAGNVGPQKPKRQESSYRMVPLNRMGSCRMMDRRDRRVCRGSLAMSMSSITILPVRKQKSRRQSAVITGTLSAFNASLTKLLFDLKCWCFTLKHVHHAEEGQREGGLAAARPATDPHLE